MGQLPPLSHWAIASQSGLADAGAAAMANGAPIATPATATRAMVRVAAFDLRCLPRLISLSLPRRLPLHSRPCPEGTFTRGYFPDTRRTGLGASGTRVLR